MDFNRLKYFVEVAKHRHFTNAALACNVSQPSLSQQVKKLEEELGGRLFERGREQVRLTELGQEFLRHARAILAEVQSAEEFAQRAQEEVGRTIRLGAIPTIAPYRAPEMLALMRARCVGARFELLESPTEVLVEALLTGKIDYALVSPPTRLDGECEYRSLGVDELLLTMPEGHRLAGVAEVSGEELAGERMLVLDKAHCLAGQVGMVCKQLGLQDHFDVRGSQIDTLLGLVENGFGLTFTPAMAVRAHGWRRVVHRSLGERAAAREVRLVWLRRQFPTRSHTQVMRAVEDWLEASAGS
jgi:LysR family hydrogen peroxide-inducible transcriptional activator